MMKWLKGLFGKSESSPPASAPPQGALARGGTLALMPVQKEQAQAEWQKRRGSARGVLVILVDPFDHIEIKEDAEGGRPAEVLAQAAEVDLAEFFAARRENLSLDEDEEADEELDAAHREPDPAKLTKATDPVRTFSGAEFGRSAFLSDIPCEAPWQVLAHYPFGGWNDTPYDHELTAVFRDWFERFGAVPALISNDVIEFWVDRPIEDPAVAAKLAMEMFWLCPDVVDQGTESVGELANALLGANVWYFWWD
ncbi:MAG: DUF4253 domain-containing protein [Armatimonadetes bacterium]|nr:DUF4253 domain-containing protein [Armatimonadota bacterium]